MKYFGKVELGGLYLDEKELIIPTKPYDSSKEVFNGSGLGNVYNFEKGNYKIGSTPTESNKKIKWNKFENENGVKIYICDRVLLNNITCEQVEQLLVSQFVYIDNKKYIQRLITEDEWKKVVLNEEGITGLTSVPKKSKTFKTLTKDTQKSNHNQLWNWVGIYTHTLGKKGCICYGFKEPNAQVNISRTFKSFDIGFRPVLEEVQIKPIISGESGRLGEMEKPFEYKYSTMSYIDNDNLRIVEKLNNVPIKEYTTQGGTTESTINLSKYWNDLPIGTQNLTIQATNSNNETNTKIVKFSTPVSTFVHKEGLDYFANQFWNVKIKPLMEDFSKRVGGLVLDSNWKEITGTKTLYATNLSDNGNALLCPITTTASDILTFSTNTLKLGKYAVGVRAMASLSTNIDSFSVSVVKNVNGTKTTLLTKNFKASDFGNSFYDMKYFMFDYIGSKESNQKLEFVVKGMASTTAHSLYLDYILISPILPAVFY